MQPKNYEDNFFDYHLQGAISSAENIIPVVKRFVNPTSVIDVGCGIGAWLSIWKKNGVKTIAGIDGEYVDTSKLLIEKWEFTAMNLENSFTLGKKYELVTCLEVAEHLPHTHAESFIESLCKLGDIILFSAAIPGQEGTMHINEQYPDYWISIFNRNGYIPIDCLRMKIWNNHNIQWWYRQNIMFFAKENTLSNYPKLKDKAVESNREVLSLVHPELLKVKIKKIDYYEEILNSCKITFKHFIDNLFRKKKE